MSTSRRITRQNVSNTPSSSKAGAPAKRKIIVINDSTPTRPAKRARITASTLRRTSARLAASSATPQRSSPHKKAIRGGRNDATTMEDDGTDDDNDDSSSSESSLGRGVISMLTKSASAATGKGFVHRSAFDAYFAAASKSSRTSNNVFSELVPPLSKDEYTTLLANPTVAPKPAELEQVLKGHEKLFPRYAFELAEGFNLLFFGFGSKRTVLNNFARSVCARRGHVVLVNGYMPRVGIREVITSIEGIPGLADVPLPTSTTGLEAQTRRIYEFFLPSSVRPQHPTSERALFLFIHNIDSPLLRAPKAKATLSLLALNPRIHLVASIDHINAQMIWSTSEGSTRKHSYIEESVSPTFTIPPTRGFAWVWHDMTTMQPYDAELAHVDLNSIRRKGGKSAATEHNMSESAAQHILASVNAKAKKLFVLLANTLLASFDEDEARSKKKEKQPQIQLQQHAVSYETLFNASRTDFIATNDTSFKALLAEFRDHGLVLTPANGEGESLWIPLRVEELRRIVTSLAGE